MRGVTLEHLTRALFNRGTILARSGRTEEGIDDLALVAKLRAVGFEVVWHERYADSRFELTRRLIERTGDSTSFKLLLRKPA